MIRSAAKNHAYVGRRHRSRRLRRRARRAARPRRRALGCDAPPRWRVEAFASHRALRRGDLRVALEARRGAGGRGRALPEPLAASTCRARNCSATARTRTRAPRSTASFLEAVESLHGKELSFNNVVDVQAALALILDFDPSEDCALSRSSSTTRRAASGRARRRSMPGAPPSRPIPTRRSAASSSSNRPFDLALAKDVDEIFTEVLIAPAFTPDALEFLRRKKNRRLLRYRPERIDRSELDVRRVFGGAARAGARPLARERRRRHGGDRAQADRRRAARARLRLEGREARQEQRDRLRDGRPHARDRRRRRPRASTRYTWRSAKAARVGHSLAGSVLASDAFFPFPDGLEAAIAAGAHAPACSPAARRATPR